MWAVRAASQRRPAKYLSPKGNPVERARVSGRTSLHGVRYTIPPWLRHASRTAARSPCRSQSPSMARKGAPVRMPNPSQCLACSRPHWVTAKGSGILRCASSVLMRTLLGWGEGGAFTGYTEGMCPVVASIRLDIVHLGEYNGERGYQPWHGFSPLNRQQRSCK